MVGRSDKGLMMTTGTFTPEAKREQRETALPLSISSTAINFVICSNSLARRQN